MIAFERQRYLLGRSGAVGDRSVSRAGRAGCQASGVDSLALLRPCQSVCLHHSWPSSQLPIDFSASDAMLSTTIRHAFGPSWVSVSVNSLNIPVRGEE